MISRTQVIMGTYITISLEEHYKKQLQESFFLLRKIDSSLSSYNPQADIYKLNAYKSTQINSYTYEALSLSKQYYKQTDGFFDISIGSITKDLFSFGLGERVPTHKELQEAVVDFKGLHFTPTHATISENIKIDLGGMGKGYGVDKVAEYLQSQSVTKGIIAASGDIKCIDSCKMQVQDPFSDGIIASFDTKHENTAITTSGNYNRYVATTKHNHLINPKKKQSQDKFISITLVSHLSNADLDAYATAASVMPQEKAYNFLDSLNLGYIVLQSDGKMVYSDTLFQFVKGLSIKYTHKK